MRRLLMDELIAWKSKKNRKPLLIQGARQVGKTWLMKEFGKNAFTNMVYLNFEKNTHLAEIFRADLDVKTIIRDLEIETGEKISCDETLLIFDEIQEVPRALTALKYFCEDAPEYYIVAAGSMLGITLHKGTSFPVGKVDFLDLYPMNFCEFLYAVGEENLADLLFYEKDYDTTNRFHDKYVRLLKEYYFVGGMPEVVSTYVDTQDFQVVRQVQTNLLLYYENDFSKHAPTNQVPRIHMVWDSIPSQLAKENKKFIYGSIKKGARAKEFEVAIQWLLDYGLLQKNICVSKPGIPLKAYEKQDAFKLFLIDVGLLAARDELTASTIIDGNQIFTEHKGALTEQYVAQELRAKEVRNHYYSTENSTGEIDFVLQIDEEIVPLEVKAEENLRAKSLRAFCDKYHTNLAYRSSMSKYRKEKWMTNIPLYAVANIVG